MVPVSTSRSNHQAATLPEVVSVVVVVALVIMMLAVFTHDARRTAMLTDDLGKLRTIASLTSQYAADHEDRFWGFSWTKGVNQSQYADLQVTTTDIQAACNQAVDIMRRHGRPDMPKLDTWMPLTTFSHLALLDYTPMLMPSRLFVSSADANRLLWLSDIEGFDQGKFVPNQPLPESASKRWPYSGSFNTSPQFFSEVWSGPLAISQHPVHYQFSAPGKWALSSGCCRRRSTRHRRFISMTPMDATTARASRSLVTARPVFPRRSSTATRKSSPPSIPTRDGIRSLRTRIPWWSRCTSTGPSHGSLRH